MMRDRRKRHQPPMSMSSPPRRTLGHAHGRGDRVLDALVAKFCSCLLGKLRHVAVAPMVDDAQCESQTRMLNELVTNEYDLHAWLAVRCAHRETEPDTSANGANLDDAIVARNQTWRSVRETLEAISVLSVVACTTTYAWRRNQRFWQPFMEEEYHGDGRKRTQYKQSFHPEAHSRWAADLIAAPRDDTLMPRFLLDLSGLEVTRDLLALCRQMLTGSPRSMRISFLRAMETMASVPTRFPIPPVIPVMLRFEPRRDHNPQMISDILALAKAVNHCWAARERQLGKSTSAGFYYRVDCVDLSGFRLSLSELSALANAVATQPIRLCQFVLDRTLLDSGTTDRAAPFSMLVSQWFVGYPFVNPDDQEHDKEYQRGCMSACSSHRGVRHVSLNWNALTPHYVAALFSAVWASCDAHRHTQSLSLRGAFQCCDPSVVWKWVTFSIFSPRSRSRLARLDLSNNVLRQTDVVTMCRVLERGGCASVFSRHSHPAPGSNKELQSVQAATTKNRRPRKKKNKNHSDDSENIHPNAPKADISVRNGSKPGPTKARLPSFQPDAVVKLRAGAQFRLEPQSDSSNRLMVLNDDTTAVVVHSDVDHLLVLVPAYGVLQLDPLSISFVECENAAPSTRPLPCQFRHVSQLVFLSMNDMVLGDQDDSDGVLRRFFGNLALPSLRHLELRGNALRPDCLSAILAACPELRGLNVENCALQSIAPLITGYRNGTCRIESLNLAENSVGGDDIAALGRLICDRTSPAAQLREINFELNPVGRRGLRALSVVVKHSTLLHLLVLSRSEDPDSAFRPIFYPFDGQILATQPLPLPQKYAFLGVLSARPDQEVIEIDILQRIFSMTGRVICRRILWK